MIESLYLIYLFTISKLINIAAFTDNHFLDLILKMFCFECCVNIDIINIFIYHIYFFNLRTGDFLFISSAPIDQQLAALDSKNIKCRC